MSLWVNLCDTAYSFFPHPSLCLVTNMNLLNRPLSSKNPRKSYFYFSNVDLVKQLPVDLIDDSQYFFHYQIEANKQPRPQNNFKK